MSNITIGRYDGPNSDVPGWSGWIEGENADGTRWITYLDADGRPALHWPRRNEDGGVIGEPITLAS